MQEGALRTIGAFQGLLSRWLTNSSAGGRSWCPDEEGTGSMHAQICAASRSSRARANRDARRAPQRSKKSVSVKLGTFPSGTG